MEELELSQALRRVRSSRRGREGDERTGRPMHSADRRASTSSATREGGEGGGEGAGEGRDKEGGVGRGEQHFWSHLRGVLGVRAMTAGSSLIFVFLLFGGSDSWGNGVVLGARGNRGRRE